MDEEKEKTRLYLRIKAVIFILIACGLFTIVIALSKIASATTSITTILFFQYFISLIAMLPWIIQQGGKNLRLSKIGVIVIRSLSGYINYALIFLAVKKIPLVNVVLLNNAAPLFIPLIIWFWKKVKIKRKLWVGIIVGFIGIALILRPNNEFFNIGALFALGSALCLSISMIAQRRLVKSESVYTISFYYFLISSLISFPFMMETWQPLDQPTMLILGIIGVLFLGGQMFFINAFKYEKPSFISPFTYSSIVYGALIEWFFWGSFPGWISILGILIVCTGGLITIINTPRFNFPFKRKRKTEVTTEEKDQSSS